MNQVISVEPYPDMTLQVCFGDGLVKHIDLRPFIGEGVSAPLSDWEFFRQVTTEVGGGIVWPNGYDFCPEFLHDNIAEMNSAQSGVLSHA